MTGIARSRNDGLCYPRQPPKPNQSAPVNLADTDLRRMDLTGVNMKDAVLFDAGMDSVVPEGADFKGASLVGASFYAQALPLAS
jgi:uncharacterized protein YjbI with pentapeptide repeats